MKLHISEDAISVGRVVELGSDEAPYTNVLWMLIIDMMRTSMLNEKHIKIMLKFVSRLYLVNPYDIKFRLTMRMK